MLTDTLLPGILLGLLLWCIVRFVLMGLYVVNQNERAVKTVFGRAQRRGGTTLDDPLLAETLLTEEHRKRYQYPLVTVIQPGGPYLKMPWEHVHKVSVATQLVSIAHDPESPVLNEHGTVLGAVTHDQLNIGLEGQLRYTVAESNLYAYLFGVKNPIAHVMGYFVSVLRERVANFEDTHGNATLPAGAPSLTGAAGISINDLRKNLGDLNDQMARECCSSAARYGIMLDAALITAINPPTDVESALAAINTTHNAVSSEISLAEAAADQKIVQSKRAVEIETLRAEAEVQVLRQLAEQLRLLKESGTGVLTAYVRNVRLALYAKAREILHPTPHD